ncbi:MAG: gamma-glutamylcyclotransferase [Acidimicrobiia bacterium]|nr:gamma-glutamylcyclotransferase [Acidimicrobiia bacterium]MDH5236072.1 gamma-glutamylcyclotransferase [Acidimicrobiia bacterium]
MTDDCAAVFIYGTLLPGELRWPVLERYALSHRPAVVDGALYDTGHGYPAAIFSEPGRIEGRVVVIDPRRLDEALDALDEVEAVDHGLYVRTVLETDHGRAWSYEYRGGLDRLIRIGSRWRDAAGGDRR